MGTIMDESLWQSFCASTFIFDLEYIGHHTNNLNECHIWEIGVIHWISGREFSITIVPDISPLPPPFSDEFITLTPQILKERNAVDFKTAWNKLIHWLHGIVLPNTNILWVAHNCFKADKPMLEIDTKRHGITMPYNWYFFDSLIYCRKNIPKQQSYTLGDIYEILFSKKIENAHAALPDAVALRDILYQINVYGISGPIYPSYTTSLQAIKWLGPSCEKHLFQHNILSLEQLRTNIMIAYSTNCIMGQPPPMRVFVETYLTTQLGIATGNATSITESIVNRWLPGTN